MHIYVYIYIYIYIERERESVDSGIGSRAQGLGQIYGELHGGHSGPVVGLRYNSYYLQ